MRPAEDPEFTGTIRGRVLLADGSPAGAGLVVFSDRPGTQCTPPRSGESACAETAEDGSFVLEKLRAMEFTVGTHRRNGKTTEGALALRIPEGSTGVTLRLALVEGNAPRSDWDCEPSPHEPAGTAITGRLVLAEGPDRAQYVALRARPASGGGERVFRPSPKGVFDTGTLVGGPWTLRVVAPSGLVLGEADNVAPGSRNLEIAVDPRGVIRGRVLLPDGAPVGPGTHVWAANQGEKGRSCPGGRSFTETVEDGSFVLEYLVDIEYGLMARGPMKSNRFPYDLVPGPAALGVKPGAREVVLRLSPRSPVKGVLLDENGQPAVPHRLVASREDCLFRWNVSTGKDGSFEFPELPAGKVRIFLPWGGKEHTLGEPEAPASDLVLRLPAKK
jgi:hypothetical protein